MNTKTQSGVSPAELLAKEIRRIGRLMRIADREYLFRQGDPAEHAFLLHRGRIKSTRTESSGGEILLTIHTPGQILGLSCLRESPVRNLNSIAMGQVEVIVVSRSALIERIEGAAGFGISLIRLLVTRFQEAQTRLNRMAVYSVQQRLASTLLDITEASKSESISLTHEELASLISSRRQTVTTLLGQFRRRRVIQKEGRDIRIINRVIMRRYLED